MQTDANNRTHDFIEHLRRDPAAVERAWSRHVERHGGVGLVTMQVSEEMPDGTRQIRTFDPVPATEENLRLVWDDAQMFADTGIPVCVVHARFLHINRCDSVIDHHFIQPKVREAA